MTDLASSWRQMTDRSSERSSTDRSAQGDPHAGMERVSLMEENQDDDEREMVEMDHESVGRRLQDEEAGDEAAEAAPVAFKKEN